MTQEQKDLLLKDLCARLPYGVKIYSEDFPKETLAGVVDGDIILHCDKYNYTYDTPWDIKDVKPYLFPMSSMTDEQNLEYLSTCRGGNAYCPTSKTFDWFDKNHFDYRGLIPMGMAIDATGKNIY